MSELKNHWQNVYNKTSHKDVSWYQNVPEKSLALIKNINIDVKAAIIDVGAGASNLVDNLLKQGFNDVTLLDISESALEITKQRLKFKTGNVKYITADITEFDSQQIYKLWHDRAVFHFLTDPIDRQKYLNVLHKSTELDSHIMIAAFAPGGPTKCSGLNIIQYDGNKITKELGKAFKLMSEYRESHITPTGKIQNFNYFHFIKIGEC